MVLLLGGGVRALPVLESDAHVLNVDGSLKSFFFAQHFARFDQQTLNAFGLGDSPWASTGVADLRLRLEGEHHRWFKWQVHYRSQPIVSSFPGAVGSLSFVAAAQPPRFLPLEVTAPDGSTFQWRHEIDRLNMQFRFGRVDLLVGRQAISFGVGFVWLPADLVGTFSPLEIDQEFKPGVDALRLNVALGDFTELTLVGALGGPRCSASEDLAGERVFRLPDGSPCSRGDVRVSSEHSVGLVRLRTNISEWDLGVLSGWVRGDLVVGAFTVGALGRFRLRSELTYTWDIERDDSYAGSGNPSGQSEHFVRAVAGTDYTFDTEHALSVFAELYYNGFGSLDAQDYLDLARQARVAEFGEIYNLGQVYLATGVMWEPHEKIPLNLMVLGNLNDPSLYASATVSYNVADESVFVAGLQLPLGKSPQFDASGTLRARSEFGLYPTLYYVQWKVYF